MGATIPLRKVIRKYRNLLLLSLTLSFILIPVIDSIIIERDRNRNMLYGQVFLIEGLEVFNRTDKDLNETYAVPSDHLLTDVLNVSYEYPIITLLVYAGLAALEPGWYGPHYIANVLFTLIFHLNIILFLYIGQNYWDRKWFWFMGGFYYFFGFFMSVGFGKADPLADFFWLVSLSLFRQERRWLSNAFLGLAFHTKAYPIMILPVMFLVDPITILAFGAVAGILFVPLMLAGVGYGALVSHFTSDPNYAATIQNPFYIGLIWNNPVAVLAPLVLVVVLLYGILDTGSWHGIPFPRPKLRKRDVRMVIIFLLPLVLIFVSWVLMWYYYWVVIPMFYLKDSEDMRKYRFMIIGLLIAHFLGVLLNFEYFLAGPIQEFFGHIKTYPDFSPP